MAVYVLLAVLALALLLVAGARLASARFGRRVAAERRELLDLATRPLAADLVPLEGLPPPVRRYLELAGAGTRAPVHSVRLVHGGTARRKPDAEPVPIRGEQVLTANPPGFVWWGRITIAPGIWIDARDELVRGKANMLVRAESAITLQDVSGAELDLGAAIRLLGELAWLPTAYRDRRWVEWTAVDDTIARATLVLDGRRWSADFHFGEDGLVSKIVGARYLDLHGKNVLRPWLGRMSDYRLVSGLLVPFRVEATWELEDRTYTPFRFVVETIEIDPDADGTSPAPVRRDARRTTAAAVG